MFYRNRELFCSCAVFALMAAVASIVAFRVGTDTGLLVLGLCLCFGALFLTVNHWRYRKLQKLSDDLEALLHNGKPLPIGEYSEGELSVLSSQIQKMTLRLKETAAALEEDRKYLADSMADISHQLRTPLTAMNLTAAMLSSAELTEKRRLELTGELKNLLSRTQWLVESLLKLSRLDAGTVRFSRESIRVDALMARASEPLSIPMELREQKLITDCAGAVIQADMVWTAEAIGNILKNAMEHTPNGGTITVTAEETALFTQITIRDTGSGFAPEDIPHLFERFYKGKNDTPKGYGIGLALARMIISAQSGTIQAANGKPGAIFTIKFYKQVI